MLPATVCRLSTRAEGNQIVPHYLTEQDHPWLRALLDEHARFVGKRRSELDHRLKEPFLVPAPRAKLAVAQHVLAALARDRAAAPLPPREARRLLFGRASATEAPREAVVAEVARSLGVRPSDLQDALFADLRSERRLGPLPEDLSPSRLAAESNLAIVTSWLRRAARVRVTATGNTRALVRQARLEGLICSIARARASLSAGPTRRPPHVLAGLDIEADQHEPGIVLDISGPFALFRHTELYGRALAALVPRVTWCHRFELLARCALRRGSDRATLVIRSGDPIGTGRELARHDSELERRFAADFARAAPDWDLLREPRPVEAGDALIFPDFELIHRRDPERRWLLEIAGFWTPEYLRAKLSRLRAARLDRLILCIDQNRCCSTEDLPVHARVIRYRRRVDPLAVLAIIEPVPGPA